MMIFVPLVIFLIPLAITLFSARLFWQSARPISYFFIFWFAAALMLNAVTFYPGEGVWVDGDRQRTPLYLALMSAPVVIYVVAQATLPSVRAAIASVPTETLIRTQIYRVAGFTFLLGYLGGLFPAALAFPATLLDMFIGLTAWPLARLVARRPSKGLVIGWNGIGLFDFGLAVSLVVASVYGLIDLDPAPSAIGQVPVIMTTLFAVPFAIVVHIEVLRRVVVAPKEAMS